MVNFKKLLLRGKRVTNWLLNWNLHSKYLLTLIKLDSIACRKWQFGASKNDNSNFFIHSTHGLIQFYLKIWMRKPVQHIEENCATLLWQCSLKLREMILSLNSLHCEFFSWNSYQVKSSTLWLSYVHLGPCTILTYLFLFCLLSKLALPSNREFLNCMNSWCMPKAAPFKRPTLEPSETTEPLKFLAFVPVLEDWPIDSCSLSQMTVSIRSKFSSCIDVE